MKRGFTLIELLGVITLLGLISLIAIPNIQKAFSDSKEELLEKQITSIENVARTWAVQNNGKLNNCYILTLEEVTFL